MLNKCIITDISFGFVFAVKMTESKYIPVELVTEKADIYDAKQRKSLFSLLCLILLFILKDWLKWKGIKENQVIKEQICESNFFLSILL